VSGSEKSRLDHDGNQQRSTANAQNDGIYSLHMQTAGYATDQRLCRSRSVEQMT